MSPIGIGDVVALSNLAFKLWRDCYRVARGAPQEFQQLLGEISSLTNALKTLHNDLDDPDSVIGQAGDDRMQTLKEMLSCVEVTLKDLEKLADKYRVLQDVSRKRRIWERIKWSIDVASVDSLRSKLIYHNTILNLLLTSIRNSSLERLVGTNRALEVHVAETKDYLRSLSMSGGNALSDVHLNGTLEDESQRISLSAKFMRNAEIAQPWTTIGIDQWLQCGYWWLEKARQVSRTTAPSELLPAAYHVNLLKAFWIISDVTTCHPQYSFISASAQLQLQSLAAEIKNEFRKLNASGQFVLSVEDIAQCNLAIWETPRRQILQQQPTAFKLVVAQECSKNIEGRTTYFQRFASYSREGLSQPQPCMVTFDSDEGFMEPKFIAQDQLGNILEEASLGRGPFVVYQASSLSVMNGRLTFNQQIDFDLFMTLIEAAFLYSDVDPDLRTPTDFTGLCLILACQHRYKEAITELSQSSLLKGRGRGEQIRWDAASVATTLVIEVDSEVDSEVGSGHIPSISVEYHDIDNYNPDDPCFNFAKSVGWYDCPLLRWAVVTGRTSVMKLCLHHYRILKSSLSNKEFAESLLEQAAFHGQDAIARLLLESGVEAVSVRTDGALFIAATAGHTSIIDDILTHRAQKIRHDAYLQALLGAFQSGSRDAISLLLNHGIDEDPKVPAEDNLHSCPGRACNAAVKLVSAAYCGDAQGVRMILEDGAGTHDLIDKPWVPLLIATSRGHEDVVRLLLDYSKAKSTVVGEEKGVRGTHTSCFRMLLRPKYKETALALAADGGNLNLVRFLLTRGADTEAPNAEGSMPLHTSTKYGILRHPLGYGANVDAVDEHGLTPLLESASRLSGDGQGDAFELLINGGADVNATDSKGQTVLHLCVIWSMACERLKRVIRLLLSRGVNINHADNQGRTALHVAAATWNGKVISVLLDHGADIGIVDAIGETAFDIATRQGYDDVVKAFSGRDVGQ